MMKDQQSSIQNQKSRYQIEESGPRLNIVREQSSEGMQIAREANASQESRKTGSGGSRSPDQHTQGKVKSNISKSLRQSATTRESFNPQINFVMARMGTGERAVSPKSKALLSAYSHRPRRNLSRANMASSAQPQTLLQLKKNLRKQSAVSR